MKSYKRNIRGMETMEALKEYIYIRLNKLKYGYSIVYLCNLVCNNTY